MVNEFDPDSPPDVPEGVSKSTMRDLPFSLVITDPNLKDHPIIYVNRAFNSLTGYSSRMAVGRNCRFLQGDGTDEAHRRVIKEAIRDERELTIDLVNYRADGEKFINRLMITPLRDDAGVTTHFLGIQTENPDDSSYSDRAIMLDESLREVQHRVKNHLSMLLALIRLEAKRGENSKASFEVLANRVEALSLLYHEFATSRDGQNEVRLGAYISRVCSALNMLDGQNDVIVNIDTESITAKVDAASQIGLLVSELLTNSLQHAFPSDRSGSVVVRLWQQGDDCICLHVVDDGQGLPAGSRWPKDGNLGSRIVRDLAARLDADLEVESDGNGTKVKIAIPMKAVV